MTNLIFDPRIEQLAIREKKYFKLNTIYNPKLGRGSNGKFVIKQMDSNIALFY